MEPDFAGATPGAAPDQPPGPPVLRVVVSVGSERVPSWIAALVGDLAGDPRFEVLVSLVPEVVRPPRRARSLRLYEAFDAALFKPEQDALSFVQLPGHLVRPLESIRSCDVLLALAPDAARDMPRPRLGTWELTWGGRREPLLLRESLRRELVETRVDAVLDGGERRSIYRSLGAPDDASPHRARNRALWKARGAVRQLLVAASADPHGFLDARDPDEGAMSEAPEVLARHVAAFAMRSLRGVVGRRVRRALYAEPWFIGIRQRMDLEPGMLAAGPRFARIEPPWGKAYADPFVLDDGGHAYVFFEDYDASRGRARISYLVVDRHGRPTGEQGTALETEYHVSYPFVFRHDGEIFMIPESSADRSVCLYRAVDFPSGWSLEQVLIRDVDAVDATLLEHGGRLWLFAVLFAEGAPPNDDLHLFSAPELGAVWEPHPGNPVVADVRRARPAGPIFRRDGVLIRPGQDCSRVYGGAIVLNRIDVLTPEEYQETPTAIIAPTWGARLEATHTYAFTETIEVVDGRTLVLRPLLRRGAGLFRRGTRGGRQG